MTGPDEHVEQAATDQVAKQQRRAPRFMTRWLTRARIDGWIDLARLRLDLYPHGLYHPVDELPVKAAKRAEGTASRWQRIREIALREKVASAVDVGSSNAYFSMGLAREGIPTLAIEPHAGESRIGTLAIRRAGLTNVGVAHFAVTLDTLPIVPEVDAVLLLSVWHHLVHEDGLAAASALLAGLWAKTRKVLFFDTGEREMPPDFQLPRMEPDPARWLTGYLETTCEGSRVEHLGTHAAYAPDGAPAERNLLAVIRAGSASRPGTTASDPPSRGA